MQGGGGSTQRYKVVGEHGAIVRRDHNTSSEEVCLLEYGTICKIAEVKGRRGRVVEPRQGWCSLTSADGRLVILEPLDIPDDTSSMASYYNNAPHKATGSTELRREIERKSEQIQRLEEQMRSMRNENNRLRAQGAGDGMQATAFDEELSKQMRKEIKELKQQKIGLSRKLSESNFELHALQEKLEDLIAQQDQDQGMASEEVRAQMRQKAQELTNLKGKYDTAVRELETERENQHRTQKRLKRKLKEAEQRLLEVEGGAPGAMELEQQRGTIKNLEKRIAALNFENRDVKHLRGTVKRLQNEIDDAVTGLDREKRRALKATRALSQQRRAALVERREIADALQEHQKQVEQVLMRERRKSIVLQRSLEDVRQYLGQKDGEIEVLQKKAQKGQYRKQQLAHTTEQLNNAKRQLQSATGRMRAAVQQSSQLKNALGQSEMKNRRLSNTLAQMKNQLQGSIARARQRARRAKRSGGDSDFLANLTNEVKGEFSKYQEATRKAALQAFDQIQNYTSMDQLPNNAKSPALPAQTAGGYGQAGAGYGGYGGYGQTAGGYGGGGYGQAGGGYSNYGNTPGGGGYGQAGQTSGGPGGYSGGYEQYTTTY